MDVLATHQQCLWLSEYTLMSCTTHAKHDTSISGGSGSTPQHAALTLAWSLHVNVTCEYANTAWFLQRHFLKSR